MNSKTRALIRDIQNKIINPITKEKDFANEEAVIDYAIKIIYGLMKKQRLLWVHYKNESPLSNGQAIGKAETNTTNNIRPHELSQDLRQIDWCWICWCSEDILCWWCIESRKLREVTKAITWLPASVIHQLRYIGSPVIYKVLPLPRN